MSETKTAKKTPMRIQYESIKAKYPDCILFFRLGDFYEMFDEDAIEAAEILDIVLTQRKSNSGNQKMCGVPFHSADSYINKLIKAGCKVAIAEQVSDPKAKGIVEREVQSVITAATNLSQNVDSLDNCSVCQFEIKNGPNGLQIDFLIADISKLQLYKGSCFSYKQLHDVWDCYKVSELVLDAANHRLMQGHLELVQTIESRKLHMKVLEEDNYDILKQSQLVELNLELKSQTGFALIKQYLQLHIGQHIQSFAAAIDHKNQLGFRLNRESIRNLEIFETLDGQPKHSLFATINQTYTSMGRNLLVDHILNPLSCKHAICSRLLKLEKLQAEQGSFDFVSLLRQIKSIPRMLARLQSFKSTPADLVNLKNSLMCSRQILSEPFVQSILEIKPEICSQVAPVIAELDELIDIEPKNLSNKGYIFKAESDKQLAELRDLLENSQGLASQMLERLKTETGIANMKIKYNKVFGYFIEVSKAKADQVPDFFIRRQTLTNAERYTTAELQEFESKILNAQSSLISYEESKFHDFMRQLQNYSAMLLEYSKLIAEIDLLHCHRLNIDKLGLQRPEITEDAAFEIEGGFHPVVKSLLPYGEFIANDLELKQEAFKLITGPNMGGKSTFLRQNAIIMLMASIGCYVPAQKATIGVCDNIFTRVGASDNLSQGLSTFMLEMTETADILAHATASSFVVIDELGRGTSSRDGIAIATSVCDFIVNKIGCRTLFATHFFELVACVQALSKAGNLRVKVSFDSSGRPVFLKKIEAGSISQSFGVEVAMQAGLPDCVIKQSQKHLETSQAQLDDTQSASTRKRPKESRRQRAIAGQPSLLLEPGLEPGADMPEGTLNNSMNQESYLELERIKLGLEQIDLNNITPLQAMAEIEKLKKLSS